MVIKSISGPSGMDELTQGEGIRKRELWELPHLTETREREAHVKQTMKEPPGR